MPVSVASTRNEIIMAHIFCVAQQFCAVTVYVLGKKVMEVVDAHIFVYMRLLFVVCYSRFFFFFPLQFS